MPLATPPIRPRPGSHRPGGQTGIYVRLPDAVYARVAADAVARGVPVATLLRAIALRALGVDARDDSRAARG